MFIVIVIKKYSNSDLHLYVFHQCGFLVPAHSRTIELQTGPKLPLVASCPLESCQSHLECLEFLKWVDFKIQFAAQKTLPFLERRIISIKCPTTIYN